MVTKLVDTSAFSHRTPSMLTPDWAVTVQSHLEQAVYRTTKPTALIQQIAYDGVRRYDESSSEDQALQIQLQVRDLSSLGQIARDLDASSHFKQNVGWLEPINVAGPLTLGVRYTEGKIQCDPTFLQELVGRLQQYCDIPIPVVMHLKQVVATNCVARFIATLSTLGFKDGFELAIKLLKQTSINGTQSPYFLAALYCTEKGQIPEALRLLREIPPSHWQFDAAVRFERRLCDDQVVSLKRELLRVQMQQGNNESALPTLDTQSPSTVSSESTPHQLREPVLFSRAAQFRRFIHNTSDCLPSSRQSPPARKS